MEETRINRILRHLAVWLVKKTWPGRNEQGLSFEKDALCQLDWERERCEMGNIILPSADLYFEVKSFVDQLERYGFVAFNEKSTKL